MKLDFRRALHGPGRAWRRRGPGGAGWTGLAPGRRRDRVGRGRRLKVVMSEMGEEVGQGEAGLAPDFIDSIP